MKKTLKVMLSLTFVLILGISTMAADGSSVHVAEETLNPIEYLPIQPGDEIPIEPMDQLLIPHTSYSTSNAVWERTFNTVGANQGRSMNVWVTNITSNRGTVFVERRSHTGWTRVASYALSANGQVSENISNITLNTEHRIRIVGTNGSHLSGRVGVRQL